ncbi:unnamed protein product [Psylliodes chrysocephalus]|uniref:Uncharacterized protein n=1 Tax=Psylliodes chrysocephalus TaxID=3402493 RepID=A0A9P0G6V4_9CUCU|nr:unnamed protein product [Psylliodes chrysocephala]
MTWAKKEDTKDEYALARQKCIKTEATSDIATSDVEEQHRRMRKATRKLYSSDEDNNSCSFIATPPRPKKNFIRYSNTKRGEYIKEMLRQQYLIKNMVTDLSIEIRYFKKPTLQENISSDDSLFKKLALPCESPAGLTKLNEHLENEENFKIAVNFVKVTEISQICEKDSYDFVKRAMSRLKTNN